MASSIPRGPSRASTGQADHGPKAPTPTRAGQAVAFRLPTFNLQANLWHNRDFTAGVPGIPPDLPALPCQLRSALASMQVDTALGGTLSISELILFPKGTDVRAAHPANKGDLLEVPAGSGRFYYTLQVSDIHKGFTNEYRVAAAQAGVSAPGFWPFPTP